MGRHAQLTLAVAVSVAEGLSDRARAVPGYLAPGRVFTKPLNGDVAPAA